MLYATGSNSSFASSYGKSTDLLAAHTDSMTTSTLSSIHPIESESRQRRARHSLFGLFAESSMTVKIFGHDDKRKIFRTRTNASNGSSIHLVADVGEIDYRLPRKALVRFHNKDRHKLDVLRHQLLPWLARKYPVSQKEISTGRNILLRWWRALMNTVVHTVYNERSYYFEAILDIMIRPEFVEFDRCGSHDYNEWANLEPSTLADTATEEDYKTYRTLLLNTLQYAIDRLNQKAVYSNVIVFCAKIFALSFFKIPGMSKALLQVLTLEKNSYRRIQTEMGSFEDLSDFRQSLISILPHHLKDLVCNDYRTFNDNLKLVKTSTPKAIEQKGNWLRRWQSDDSELFFAFYKHYHLVLKEYLQRANLAIPCLNTTKHKTTMLSIAPAYVFLAAFFQGKIDSLLHREINSVTTIVQWDSNGVPKDTTHQTAIGMENDPSFEASTNISNSSSDDGRPISTYIGSSPPPPGANYGKPKVLELATRRYAECVVKSVLCCDQGSFHGMADVWVRAAIKRTKLCAVESIFCLFDLLEMIVHGFTAHSDQVGGGSFCSLPINVTFLLDTIRMILQQSDHTITLVRTLSFVYNHFELLTRDSVSMTDLCLNVLLNPSTFERLFLHWSRNVRVFFIRTLLWRVGPVWKDAHVNWNVGSGLPQENICQQDQCWSRLHQSGIGYGASISSFHAAYERSALEAHIVLESLLMLFYTQFQFLETKIDGLQSAEKLRFLTTLSSKVLPQPTVTPAKESRRSPADTEGEFKREKPKRALTFGRSTKKRTGGGGDKLMRFFSMRTPKTSKTSRPRMPSLPADVSINSSTTSTTKSSILHVSSGLWSEEDDNQSSNTAASTSSSNVSVFEPKNLSQSKNNMFATYMSQTSAWRYEGKSHVYAKKAVAEANTALMEFVAWEQKLKAGCGSGMPCLGLDWPKNWTESSVYQQSG